MHVQNKNFFQELEKVEQKQAKEIRREKKQKQGGKLITKRMKKQQ